MSLELNALLPKALGAAETAGAIIARNIDRKKRVERKGRIDLVTDTDLAVEKFLKEELAAALPGAGFLAEESASGEDPGDPAWIVDPLDGTTNFAHGFPFVATSIALRHDGDIVLGVVNAPVLGECFHAIKSGGAFCNGEPISVTDEDDLLQCLVATGFPYAIEEHADRIVNNLRRVLLATQGVRRPGSAAIDLAYTACGRYDGFYESALKPWDTAAGWLLVTEAGGKVTQVGGDSYAPGAPTILATNGRIHSALDRLLEI